MPGPRVDAAVDLPVQVVVASGIIDGGCGEDGAGHEPSAEDASIGAACLNRTCVIASASVADETRVSGRAWAGGIAIRFAMEERPSMPRTKMETALD